MDEKKALKDTELNDRELDAVSGGTGEQGSSLVVESQNEVIDGPCNNGGTGTTGRFVFKKKLTELWNNWFNNHNR